MIHTIDLLNYIKDVASTFDVNQVCIGDVFELNAKADKLYPLINIDVENINIGKTSSEYNIQILVIDRFDEKTLYYSLSHTQYFMVSLIMAIRKDLNEMINVNYPILLNDVRDSFQDDRVCGWLATITFNVPFVINNCKQV
jgi:ribosomal protein S3AE